MEAWTELAMLQIGKKYNQFTLEGVINVVKYTSKTAV
jgi:hypothetical protein